MVGRWGRCPSRRSRCQRTGCAPGWPAWPRYAEILGGSFLYRPARLRERDRPASGYRHGVEYTAEVLAPEHPVMAGIPATFAMRDELYMLAGVGPVGIR